MDAASLKLVLNPNEPAVRIVYHTTHERSPLSACLWSPPCVCTPCAHDTPGLCPTVVCFCVQGRRIAKLRLLQQAAS